METVEAGLDSFCECGLEDLLFSTCVNSLTKTEAALPKNAEIPPPLPKVNKYVFYM